MKKVIWDKQAIIQLEEIHIYAKEFSIVAADKIVKSIKETTRQLNLHPEAYPLDRFKLNNDGSFRVFENYSYRVSYRVQEELVIILRVRHIKREPLEF